MFSGQVWNQKTVIRGGYSIYYSAGNGLTGGFCIPCSLGFTTSLPRLTSPDGFTPGLFWDNGFQPPAGYIPPPFVDPGFANGQSLLYINPKSGQAPRIHNYNLNIQREFGRFLVDIAYAGARGRRLSSFRDPLNALDPKYLALGSLLDQNITSAAVVAAGFTRPYPSFTGTLAQALRPFPQFLNINGEYDPIGRSWYDSLQFKVERRYSSLTLQASYVWSKSLTDATGTQTTGNPSGFNIRSQNPNDDKAEKSYLYADWPHVLNILWSYDLPFGKGKRFLSSSGGGFIQGVASRVVGGWTLSGVQQYRSGALIQVTIPTTGTSIFGSGSFDQRKRPNVTGQSFLTGVDRTKLDPRDTTSRWLNRAAFGVTPAEGGPGTYQYGNAANFYSDLRQPPVFLENFSIIKRTAISETVNFEFRAEMQNVFNRTNFGGVNGNLQSADFGRPTGPQVGARIIQMAAKINF